MDKRALGERIRAARKALGWTQEVLANKLFISESYLTLIELGKRNVSVDTLATMCDVLGLSADYLLFGSTTPTPNGYAQQFSSLSANRPACEVEGAIKVAVSFYDALDGVKTTNKKEIAEAIEAIPVVGAAATAVKRVVKRKP